MWATHSQGGDDVAPTSLTEGRGKVLVLVLAVVLHLGLKCWWMDGGAVMQW